MEREYFCNRKMEDLCFSIGKLILNQDLNF